MLTLLTVAAQVQIEEADELGLVVCLASLAPVSLIPMKSALWTSCTKGVKR